MNEMHLFLESSAFLVSLMFLNYHFLMFLLAAFSASPFPAISNLKKICLMFQGLSKSGLTPHIEILLSVQHPSLCSVLFGLPAIPLQCGCSDCSP